VAQLAAGAAHDDDFTFEFRIPVVLSPQ